MWEIENGWQIFSFACAVAFGFFLCLLYDVLKAYRKTATLGVLGISVTDLLYFIFSALLTFLFLLVFSLGQIRLYLLLGMLAGFILCRKTFSRIWLKIFLVLFGFVKKICLYISDKLNRFSHFICLVMDRFLFFIKKISKKALKRLKNS